MHFGSYTLKLGIALNIRDFFLTYFSYNKKNSGNTLSFIIKYEILFENSKLKCGSTSNYNYWKKKKKYIIYLTQTNTVRPLTLQNNNFVIEIILIKRKKLQKIN